MQAFVRSRRCLAAGFLQPALEILRRHRRSRFLLLQPGQYRSSYVLAIELDGAGAKTVDVHRIFVNEDLLFVDLTTAAQATADQPHPPVLRGVRVQVVYPVGGKVLDSASQVACVELFEQLLAADGTFVHRCSRSRKTPYLLSRRGLRQPANADRSGL